MNNSSPYSGPEDENVSNRPITQIGSDLLNRFRRLRSELCETSLEASSADLPVDQSIINSIDQSVVEEPRDDDQQNHIVDGSLVHNRISKSNIENTTQEEDMSNHPLLAVTTNLIFNESSTQDDDDDSIMENIQAFNQESLRIQIINRVSNEQSTDDESITDTSSTESSNDIITDNNSSLNSSLPVEMNLNFRRYRQRTSSQSRQDAPLQEDPIPSTEIQKPITDKDCGCFQGLTGIGIQDDGNGLSQFCFIDSKNPSNVLNGLNELRQNKLMCDVILKVQDEEFHCHKCVLASLSSYFRAMFSLELAESKQSKVCLNELDPNTMRLIIDYAYTSKLNINESNVQALLSSANLFDIKPLREACCRYMEWQMDDQNCVGVYCFSDTHCCNELKEIAFKYILNNFRKVVQHEEYLSLTPPKLIDIIKNDNLNVTCEDCVYEACIKWLEHSPNERITSFHKILEHVRLPLLKPYFLYDKVQNNNLLKQSDECSFLIKEAFDYNFLKDRRNQIQNHRTRSRKYFKHLESLIIICGENDEYVLRTVEAYIPSLGRWLGLRNFPFSLTKSGVVATEETILYIAGGERSDLSATDAFWQYNSILDEWKELQNMQTHRTELGLAIVDGCVYAIGGKDLYGSPLASVECYDPLLNIWKYCAFMSSSLVNPAVCSLNGLLYVMADKFNQYYNPSTNMWYEFPKPQTPRLGSRACGLNGRIYLIGGFCEETTNLVECFNTAKNQWECCAPMLEARRHPGVAILSNQIYVCGGENSSGEVSNTIEAYDIETDEWNFISVMKKERSWLSCASLRLENPLINPFNDSKNNEANDSISNSVC